jgi:hypothetical protein
MEARQIDDRRGEDGVEGQAGPVCAGEQRRAVDRAMRLDQVLADHEPTIWPKHPPELP